MEDKQQVVCSNCLSINRVVANRLDDDPLCGKCKSNLLTGQPIELNDTNFTKITTKNSLPVIVDFWAEWCRPCQIMSPSFTEVAKELKSRAILTKVNTEIAQQTATRFSIRSIPTLIAFKNGKEIARQSGALNKEQIIQWAQSII